MPIETLNDLARALGNTFQQLPFDKASLGNAVAGQLFSLFRVGTIPAQPAIPAAARLCNNLTAGGLTIVNPTPPAVGYVGRAFYAPGQTGQGLRVYDRLADMGGLNATLTTAQTVGVDLNTASENVPARIGAANYSDVEWFLEWYADTGATASNATVAVTYDDGSTGNLALVAVGGTVRNGRLIPLLPSVPGRWIRAVTSVTLSASTTAAGNFGVTAMRPILQLDGELAGVGRTLDWSRVFSRVAESACIVLVAEAVTTTTGSTRGVLRYIAG
jgi:hypothetical protein